MVGQQQLKTVLAEKQLRLWHEPKIKGGKWIQLCCNLGRSYVIKNMSSLNSMILDHCTRKTILREDVLYQPIILLNTFYDNFLIGVVNLLYSYLALVLH